MSNFNLQETYSPSEMPRDFRGIWIPREVWLCNELSIIEKSLWCEIQSLHDRKLGACYASNAYLSKFMQCSPRHLQRYLARLQKGGFLEVFFIENKRYMKAVFKLEDIECKQHAKNKIGGGCHFRQGGVMKTPGGYGQSDTPPHYSNKNKEENKDKKKEDCASSAGAPTSKKSPSSDEEDASQVMVKRRPNVELSDMQYQALIDKHGDALVQRALDDLSEWKADKSAKEIAKASDYGRLKKWVINAVKEADLKERELKAREERLTNTTKSKERDPSWDNKNQNEMLFNQAKEALPEALKTVTVKGNYVVDSRYPSKEVFLKMEPKAFEKAFSHLTGVMIHDK
jgi:hypothetical protein